MKKKIDGQYVGFDVKEAGFDVKETGMDNRGEYVRISTKEVDEVRQAKELVDHPDHYNKGIEVIDFIESWGFDFATGNIIKYIARHNLKDDPVDDLKKARWYIDRLIEAYEREEK
jgi:hypothetical protein